MKSSDPNTGSISILVRDRTRIQQLSLALLQLMQAKSGDRARGDDTNRAYNLLVGAVFSLWRAVFLAQDERDWPKVLSDAEVFLEKIIRHNAIGYMDDWNNRKWSFLFYIDNAHYRILELAELLPKLKGELEQKDFRAPQTSVGATWLFNVHCNIVDRAIYILETQEPPRKGQSIGKRPKKAPPPRQ